MPPKDGLESKCSILEILPHSNFNCFGLFYSVFHKHVFFDVHVRYNGQVNRICLFFYHLSKYNVFGDEISVNDVQLKSWCQWLVVQPTALVSWIICGLCNMIKDRDDGVFIVLV